MATNANVNKVIVNNQTLIDLTGDTITATDVINGKQFHDKSGAVLTGTSTYDADTSDATASAGEILATKSAYVSGTKVTGTMPNNASTDYVIDDISDELAIAAGYHDGGGKAKLAATEIEKIVAANIREGITILGVTGNMTGTEDVVAGSPTVTPTFSTQTIVPNSANDENYLSQVTVNPIPVAEVDNASGGKTVTIG